MDSKKKLIITLSIMCVALILAIVGVVVVLVMTTASASSSVKVEFTADRVQVNVTGSYTTGGRTTPITKDGVALLVFTSDTKSDAFDSTGTISLSASSPRIVFEYTFTNTHSTVDAKIELLASPTHNNVTIGYAYSNVAIDDFSDIETNTSFEQQLVGAGMTKYVYIVVEVSDLMSNARYGGTLQFGLSRVSADEVVEVSFDFSGYDVVNADQFVSYKALKASYIYEPMCPIVNNKCFDQWEIYWYYDDDWLGYDYTRGGTPFPMSANSTISSSNKFVFMPTYIDSTEGNKYSSNGDGTCTFTGCGTYLSGLDLVIPDMYNGELVTKISDHYAYFNAWGYSLLSGNINNIYISNYVEEIPSCFIGNGNASVSGNIYLGRSVEKLHDYAFYGVSIDKVNFNDNIRYVGYNALNTGSYSSMKYINCYNNTNAAVIAYLGANTFESLPNDYQYIALLPRALNEYSSATLSGIPQTITMLPPYVFGDNSTITSIQIPSNIKYIGNTICSNVLNVSSVVVSPYNKYYDSRNSCNAIIETATDKMIFACRNTTIPATVQHIGRYAFAGASIGITSLRLPLGLKTIEDVAFYYCESLTSIEFPSTLEYIGNNAFDDGGMDYANSNPKYFTNAINVGGGIAIRCWDDPTKYVLVSFDGTSTSDITVWNDIVCFRDKLFSDNSLFAGSWVAPTNLNGLSWGLFSNNTNITSITLNDGLKYIGEKAFAYSGPSPIMSITVPSSVEYIHAWSVYNPSWGSNNITYVYADSASTWVRYSWNNIQEPEYVTTSQFDISGDSYWREYRKV